MSDMYSAYNNDENANSHDVLKHHQHMIDAELANLQYDDNYFSEFELTDEEPEIDQLERQIKNLEKRRQIVQEILWSAEAFYEDTDTEIERLRERIEEL